jgi:hypothetical protein
MSSAHSASASSSGGQGGSMFVRIPCTPQGTLCSPGDVCCYHVSDPTKDHCGTPGSCGTFSYDEFSCNNSDDCFGGQCCAYFDFFGSLSGITCKPSCDSGDVLMCKTSSNCSGGTTCVAFPNSNAPYPGYKWCH